MMTSSPRPSAPLRALRTLDDLPHELRDAVAKELLSGESVLWTGQPSPLSSARSCIPIVLFGIPWTTFSVFWTVAAAAGLWSKSGGGAPLAFKIFFPLWGLPFVAIGFGMLLSPWFAIQAARRTAYIITDRRLLEISLGRGNTRKVQAFVPFMTAGLPRQERADGSGDLKIPRPFGGMTNSGSSDSDSLTLLGIPNVRQVEQLLLSVFGSPASAGASAVSPSGGVGALPAHRAGAPVSPPTGAEAVVQQNSTGSGSNDSNGSNAPWWTSARE